MQLDTRICVHAVVSSVGKLPIQPFLGDTALATHAHDNRSQENKPWTPLNFVHPMCTVYLVSSHSVTCAKAGELVPYYCLMLLNGSLDSCNKASQQSELDLNSP